MGRRLTVRRVIPVLGVMVLVLGAVGLWAVSRGDLAISPVSADQRATRQVRAQLGRSGEVRYLEAGERRAACGYAGRKGEARAVAFVSRPNRILFSDDPLPGEFREMQKRFCPGFLTSPPEAGAVRIGLPAS